MNQGFDYSKLKGLIIQKYGSQVRFAKEIGVSKNHLSLLLTNKRRFTSRMIDLLVNVLEIKRGDVGEYFFIPLQEDEKI